MASEINPAFPIPVSPTTQSVRQNFAIAAQEITDLQERLNGGGPGGPVQFSAILGDPTDNVNLNAALNAKQNTLVWTGGSNTIRTVGGQSLQGPGDIPLPAPGEGAATWPTIPGDPMTNTALAALFNAKQNTLVWTGGSNTIRTVGGQTLQGPGNIQFVTVNGQSLLGSGDIVIEGGSGGFTGGQITNPMQINLSGGGMAATTAPPLLHLAGQGTSTAPLTIDGIGAPTMELRRMVSSMTDPQPVGSGSQLGFLRVLGFNGTAFSGGFEIQTVTSQAWNVNQQGTQVLFSTTTNNTSQRQPRITIGMAGGVAIGNSASQESGSLNVQTTVYINGVALEDWLDDRYVRRS